MKSFARILTVFVLLASYASSGPLDAPMAARSANDVFRRLNELKSSLSDQEVIDLSIAIRCIERETCEGFAASESEAKKNQFFVFLIDGRTPRQVILTGAALAGTRSFHGLDGKTEAKLDYADKEFRNRLAGFSKYAFQHYVAIAAPSDGLPH